jgi:hypothetical protein
MSKGLGRSLLLLAAFFASVPLWFRTSFRTPDWTLDYVFAALFGLIGLWLIEGGEHGQASPVYRGALLLVAGIGAVVLSGALAGTDPGAITWLGAALGAVGAWQLLIGLANVRRQQQ